MKKSSADIVPKEGFESASGKRAFDYDRDLIQRTAIKREKGRLYHDAATGKDLVTFTNPDYTDQDLEFFEQAWSDSVAGTTIDKKVEFVIGKGIRPVFELIDDSLDDEAKERELDKYSEELHELETIDNQVNFNNKVRDAVRLCKVFGRCIGAFDGLKGNDIPSVIKLIHPRDTGRIFIDQDTWNIEKVRSNFPAKDFTSDEMIYFVNMDDSPKRRNKWYGFSELERIVGAARAWRRIVEFDMPEAATAGWASYGMFLVKKMGRTDADAQTDMNELLDSLKPHAFNAVSVDSMDEIQYMPVDLQPKLKEMVELASFYERIIIGNSAVPSALLGREEDQNRATLIGKIRFFIEGPVAADREWLSNILSEQWYKRNLIKLGHKDILDKVRVKAEFEPIFMESWDDQVQAMLQLKTILPNIPDETILDLLNLEEKKNDILNNDNNVQVPEESNKVEDKDI